MFTGYNFNKFILINEIHDTVLQLKLKTDTNHLHIGTRGTCLPNSHNCFNYNLKMRKFINLIVMMLIT
jgi:hypothetical protein